MVSVPLVAMHMRSVAASAAANAQQQPQLLRTLTGLESAGASYAQSVPSALGASAPLVTDVTDGDGALRPVGGGVERGCGTRCAQT